MDGLRKCFEEEFSSIYVYNLRGNARTQGEIRRKEKDNVFGQGSRAPIAITILVKNPKTKNTKANIYYRDIGDYLSREEKLNLITKQKSVATTGFTQQVIKPNENSDWLNQRSDNFSSFIPIQPDKKFNNNSKSVFILNTLGINTNRDAWVYNFSHYIAIANVTNMIKIYNKMVDNVTEEDKLEYNPTKIAWSSSLVSKWKQKKYIDNKIINITSLYRPFSQSNLSWIDELIHRKGQFVNIYPNSTTNNKIICVSGIGGTKDFSCLITNYIADIQLMFNGQCFPLYWYEEKIGDPKQQNIFELNTNYETEITYEKHDGITDFILNEARSVYKTNSITKEDIFYYVYGLLHSPDYRSQFEADLKKMLPRIPLVDSAADFKAFSSAGRKLADLHLNYEKLLPPESVVVEGDTGHNYLVNKMKFKSKEDKTEIIYNSQITIKNIPLEAYDYVVNGRSAIEWIMERYQVKVDKASQIKNDPNDWAREHNDQRYILDLLLSIITVSLETVRIINSLPKLKFE